MVFVGSLSAPNYKLVDNPKYAGIVKDFEHSFAVLEALPCDIALAPHPGMVDFWERVAKRDRGDTGALVDPTLCRAYARRARENFAEELAKQRRDAALATERR
jgi:metallo-beta-lactamase class B